MTHTCDRFGSCSSCPVNGARLSPVVWRVLSSIIRLMNWFDYRYTSVRQFHLISTFHLQFRCEASSCKMARPESSSASHKAHYLRKLSSWGKGLPSVGCVGGTSHSGCTLGLLISSLKYWSSRALVECITRVLEETQVSAIEFVPWLRTGQHSILQGRLEE